MSTFKTIFEPFKIKMVEPIKMTDRTQRLAILDQAHFNLFSIRAENVMIDLLTDSGTSAMSQAQWSALLDGDESYAGCRSFYDFEAEVKKLTGYKFIFPTHQGRAAERILFSIVGGQKKSIPSNTHFDTTRANIEASGAEAIDLLIEEGKNAQFDYPFKGNMDVKKLEALIEKKGASNIPICMITVTNNSGGGQPVSMQNIKDISAICKKYQILFYIDACRFAENAYFIKHREAGYADKSIFEIAKEMFSYADGCTMSAKKDAFVNMGGFLALNDEKLAYQAQNLEILTEGYPTYGGLAGRDLAAMAQGLREIVNEDYLAYRIASTEYLGKALQKVGIPIVQPVGGHAVYIDAKALLPHIPVSQFPGQALACALFLEGGIRTVEIGSLMFGTLDQDGHEVPAEMELVRLAIPRRVYTQSHIDYVIEVLNHLYHKRHEIRGLKILESPPVLRHFTAKLCPV